ncbi:MULTISPECIES: lipoprotein LpqH [Mycobacteroides]|jgi:ipoprotein LpqH|uniref:Lipoprotein LpqH n=2 Tax=Mycobacteroides TaxID=670516 RepID=A0A1S1LYU8_MYCCH|nr:MULTISPECIES: lipoprotein LpqH [Mycobacteroides]AYM40908.1 hypothetical protein DYE20_04455 [[Mycobacterium] chelonae subsp. gwanakae]KRQ25040.1 hypothetical protein AOT91_21605 [Mycobacteroides sp. H092]KRQ26582.1 hypothetical protein AOT87_00660 [Mycobacteroides sp. H003]KRQ46794.1 hypothetical protein AOT92_01170 [Mycobacteroides sp. H101]KRQ51689.1 hypothetical protein AOT88_04510 [Mycobacteroides sp. H063]
MKRGLVVAIGGAAIIAAGLVGCSSDKSSTTVSGNGGAVATNSTAKVVIDGKEQKIEGAVVCQASNGNVNIVIGSGAQGFGAVVTEGDSPTVKSAGLGSLNGQSLAFSEGTPGANAKATKDGKKYHIEGTAIAVDMANPMQPSNKPFEIEVTCP